MEEKVATKDCGIGAISFDKMLSISNLFGKVIRYGSHCCLLNINTDTDKELFKYPVRINAFIFVVCSNGLIELTYNLFRITLSSNNLFIYKPGTIFRINAIESSQLSIMIFTREFFDELGFKLDNIPLHYRIMREHQTFPLSEDGCRQISDLMTITGEFASLDASKPYYNEMVKSAFRTFLYRGIYAINARSDNKTFECLPKQENTHFENFMRLLEENYKTQHSIKFYADRMSLTPKYLSLMIKKVSGKLATEWIDEYVVLEAKNLIKYSSLSIQEIAYALNFTNQSFFGKYFKRHTGLSPKAYRLQQ